MSAESNILKFLQACHVLGVGKVNLYIYTVLVCIFESLLSPLLSTQWVLNEPCFLVHNWFLFVMVLWVMWL